MPPPRPSWQVHSSSQWTISTPDYVFCIEHINITPQEMRVFYALKSSGDSSVNIDIFSTADINESLVIDDQMLGRIYDWKVGVLHVLRPSNIIQFIILRATYDSQVREVILLEQVQKQAHRNTTWSYFNLNRPNTIEILWYGPVTQKQVAYFAKNDKKIYIEMENGSNIRVITGNEYDEYIADEKNQ